MFNFLCFNNNFKIKKLINILIFLIFNSNNLIKIYKQINRIKQTLLSKI